MTINFTAPPKSGPTRQLAITTTTHDILKRLSAKHGISMTKLTYAIVAFHDKNNEIRHD